jgi:tartrate-resistant acid phosphatase type 5
MRWTHTPLYFALACNSAGGQPPGSDAGSATPGADEPAALAMDGGKGTGPRDAGGGSSSDAALPAYDSGGPSGRPLQFVAVGDTGKGNSGQRAVAAAVRKTCAARGCDFVTLLGDNIYESGLSSASDPQAKTKFEDVYTGINVDFQIVLGNHDYGGDGSGTEFGKAQFEIDYSAKSTKWKLPAAHYRFQKSIADFFVLDTNLMMFNRHQAQKVDVPAWLAESKAPWKIVLGHHPYKSNGPHGNAGNYEGLQSGAAYSGNEVKTFFDTVVCGKADVYFAAHDHTMQVLTERCNGTALFVSGAGAETTELTRKNAVKFASLELGFAFVSVEPSKLTVEFISDTGAILFTESIKK